MVFKKSLIFSVILFFGILLRFYNLNYENLWFDEIISFWISDPNIDLNETIIRHRNQESIPITYYLILKKLHNLFYYSPEIGRYLSSTTGTINILLIWVLSRQISKNNSNLMALFLVSFNIYLIMYSQEMRVYNFSFFICCINLILIFKSISDEREKYNVTFFGLIIFQILNIIIFPYTILIFISLIIYIFYQYYIFNFISKKINYALIIVIIFLCFYILFYFSYSSLSIGWIEQPDLSFFTNFYFSKFFGSRLLGIVHLFFLLTLIIFFRKKIFVKKNKNSFLVILIICTYFFPLVYGYLIKPVIYSRYIIYVLIPIILLLSYVIFEIKNDKIKIFLISILVFLNFGNHFSESTFKQFYKERIRYKPNFDQMINYIGDSNYRNYQFDIDIPKEQSKQIYNALVNYIGIIDKKNKITSIDFNFDFNKQKFWNICLLTISKTKCSEKTNTENYNLIDEKYFSGIKIKLLEKSNDK